MVNCGLTRWSLMSAFGQKQTLGSYEFWLRSTNPKHPLLNEVNGSS